MKEQKEKILLMRLDRLGDLVLTLPAIHVVREHFPEAKIEIVVHQEFVSFVQEIFPNAEVMGIERKRSWKRGVDILAVIKKIRKTKYDYALDLFTGTNHLSSVLLFFANAKRKCGYGVGLRKYFLKEMVPPAKEIKYEAEMVMDILRILGIPTSLRKKGAIPIRQEVEKKIMQKVHLEKSKYIIIHPWASEQAKEWPVAKYTELLKMLLKEKSRKEKIVLIGSKEEKQKAEKITNALTEVEMQRVCDLTGELSLIEIATLIKSAALFIGGNSGPMHIAATYKTPSVIISGYSSPVRWDPPVREVRVIRSMISEKIDAEQHYANKGFNAREEKIMHIQEIPVEKVYSMAIQVLKKKKESNHG